MNFLNFLKKPIFYLTFIITLFVGLKVEGWDFLGIWTFKNSEYVSENYIKENVVDDTAIKIVFLAIDLSEGRYYQYQLLKDSISLLKKANILIKLNVLDLLKDASNRQVTLEGLILRIDHVLSQMDDVSSQILLKINEYNTLYNQCLSEKNLWDSHFFEWIRIFDYEMVINWLNESAKWWSCSEKNRIYMRWYQKIYYLLEKYKYLLKLKYNILANNEDLIIQNIYLFEWNYLDQLVELKKQLSLINGNLK